jgi:hypothetical protein
MTKRIPPLSAEAAKPPPGGVPRRPSVDDDPSLEGGTPRCPELAVWRPGGLPPRDADRTEGALNSRKIIFTEGVVRRLRRKLH